MSVLYPLPPATPSGRVAMVGGEDLVDDTIQEDGGPGRASNVNRIEVHVTTCTLLSSSLDRLP